MLYLCLDQLAVSFLSSPLRYLITAKFDYVSVTSRGTTENWQRDHVYSTWKQRGNGVFQTVSTRNTRDVLVGKWTSLIIKNFFPWKNTTKAQRHSQNQIANL